MKTMKKLIAANAAYGTRRQGVVFSDFCALAATSLRNAVDQNGWQAREDAYLAISAGYDAAEMHRFSELLAEVTVALTNKPGDVLGELYMSLDLGNDRLGQFFTPFSASTLAAQLTVEPALEKLKTQPFITMLEPAAGSGGMVVALAEVLRSRGVNYQQSLHVTAWDLDIIAVHMTYIQLSLLSIPAVIVHGNTLSLERYDVWSTPAHILGGWSSKLRAQELVP